ncbi:MAG TPA: ABC transporter permease [Acidobacteriaceae bacterium]|nr:ABC transporter permease [Acidobacteriaceae bacterium]
MTNLINDLRYAVRQLRKSPGFALTAILILALGIGANAAMFTVLNAVLLRPLPYADVNRLVVPTLFDQHGQRIYGAMYPDIKEWQTRARTLSGIAYARDGSQYLSGVTGGETVSSVQSSANLFSVLGIQPQIGRTYGLEEQTPGRDHVVVLSDPMWDKYFHRNPNALGKTVKLDGQPYTVIGVMPKGFSYPYSVGRGGVWAFQSEVWIPLPLAPDAMTRSGPSAYYGIIGRLKPGVSLATVQTELNNLQHQISKEYPAGYAYPVPLSVQMQSYRDSLTEQFRPSLLVLEAACLMLWLIACANVTGLLLVRGSARQREIAVRGALGARRTRLLWQSMTESLLLSVAATGAGIGLAVLTLHVFRRALLQRIDLIRDIHLNLPIVGILAAFSIVTAVVCGLTPALLTVNSPALQALQHGGLHSSSDRRQKHVRDGLIVVEIALSLTLLVACGLLLRTLYALRHEPLGIRTDHVLTADFNLPGYLYHDTNLVAHLYQPLLAKTQQLPDVQAASLSTYVPLDAGFWVQFEFWEDGKKPPPGSQYKRIYGQIGAVTADMQRVFGFRMLQGRFFNAEDTYTSQPVVVVNRAFAKEYWPDGKAIGKQFMQLHKGKDSREIVIGVMDDLPQRSLADKRGPQILVCLSQLAPGDNLYTPTASVHMQLAVRTREQPEVVIPEIRNLLGQLAPQLRGLKIETMNQVVEDSMGDQNLAAHLLELFGGTALIITLAGLYGSLLYAVSLRRREMAVRLAVGAQRLDILKIVLLRAVILLSVGLGAGTAISYATGRFLQSYTYKVHPGDPVTLLAACLLFLICGLLAAYLPARRAAMTEPIEILREE